MSGAATEAMNSVEADTVKPHPISEIFPVLSGPAFDSLVEDIKANGLLEDILLHPDGSIIDGRNRYAACLKAGVEPRYRKWDGKSSLTALVLSLNLHRRHLSASQRAMVAAKAKELFAEQAQERLHLSNASKANLPESEKGQARDKAAELLNVSPRSVQAASKVLENGAPELVKAVEDGVVAVSNAAHIAELPQSKQGALLNKARSTTRSRDGSKKKIISKANRVGQAKRRQRGKAKASPEPKAVAVKPDFERTICDVMRIVDAVLEGCSDDQRNALLFELITTLEKMR